MGKNDVIRIQAEMAQRELARRNYGEYLAYVNGNTWVRTRFGNYLTSEVQRFIEGNTGNAYDILVIESPPQHGKSMTLTEGLASWCMGKFPEWRIILASYNDETAERFARRNKEKVRNYGEALFGIKIGRIDRATEFELEGHAGRLISRGIKAGITGNPANLLIVDDPIKNRQEADSPTTRQQIWGEWLNSLKSRLAAGAKVVVIMTPWHEDDMAARLLATEKNIRLIRLPVEAELDDPLGRAEGEPLCPEIGKDKKWLEQFKDAYLNDPEGGPRAWSALYMCNPRVEGGNLVKREWWKYYDPKEITSFATEIISVDATFKGGEDNDFVAIEVWGKLGNDYYCRYVMNRHLDFPGTLEAILQVRRLYPNARAVLVEDKANGSAIIQVLQKHLFPTYEDSEAQVRADLQYHPDAIRTYLNEVLLPALEAATAADHVGASDGYNEGTLLSVLAEHLDHLLKLDEDVATLASGGVPSVSRCTPFTFSETDWVAGTDGYTITVMVAQHNRTSSSFGYNIWQTKDGVLDSHTWNVLMTRVVYAEDGTEVITLTAEEAYDGVIVFFGV